MHQAAHSGHLSLCSSTGWGEGTTLGKGNLSHSEIIHFRAPFMTSGAMLGKTGGEQLQGHKLL